MNSFASSFFRGFAKIDLNHLRAFKNIQNSWQEWQGYGGTSSFRGYLPTTLCQGDMNLYRELMAISRYLYSYLHEAGMQKYFLSTELIKELTENQLLERMFSVLAFIKIYLCLIPTKQILVVVYGSLLMQGQMISND